MVIISSWVLSLAAGLEAPTGPPARAGPLVGGEIVCRPVLGALHHGYEWLAA
jgi:hypothetical protein